MFQRWLHLQDTNGTALLLDPREEEEGEKEQHEALLLHFHGRGREERLLLPLSPLFGPSVLVHLTPHS